MTNPFLAENYRLREPEQIICGRFTAWAKELPVSTGYTASYQLRDPVADLTASVAGTYDETLSRWLFVATSAVTTAWVPSRNYSWDLVVTRTSDGEAMVLESGYVEVFGSDADRKTHAEIMIRKINSILENRAESDVSSYTIRSRSITKMSIQELIEWRDYYTAEVNSSAARGGAGPKRPARNSVTVRFS